MYKHIYLCSIIVVFSSSAMELEQTNKTSSTQKHIPKSPIMRVKTAEDIKTDPNEQDEFKLAKDQEVLKYTRRRSRSLENEKELILYMQQASSTLTIAELEPNKSLKKFRSLSLEQLKQSSSKHQLPDLSLLTIKEKE